MVAQQACSSIFIGLDISPRAAGSHNERSPENITNTCKKMEIIKRKGTYTCRKPSCEKLRQVSPNPSCWVWKMLEKWKESGSRLFKANFTVMSIFIALWTCLGSPRVVPRVRAPPLASSGSSALNCSIYMSD